MPIDASPHSNSLASALLLLAALTVGGCALPNPAAEGPRFEDGPRLPSARADSGRGPASQAATHHEPRYLRF